jgi:hypothetical protein
MKTTRVFAHPVYHLRACMHLCACSCIHGTASAYRRPTTISTTNTRSLLFRFSDCKSSCKKPEPTCPPILVRRLCLRLKPRSCFRSRSWKTPAHGSRTPSLSSSLSLIKSSERFDSQLYFRCDHTHNHLRYNRPLRSCLATHDTHSQNMIS